jgi:hypothetical protein
MKFDCSLCHNALHKKFTYLESETYHCFNRTCVASKDFTDMQFNNYLEVAILDSTVIYYQVLLLQPDNVYFILQGSRKSNYTRILVYDYPANEIRLNFSIKCFIDFKQNKNIKDNAIITSNRLLNLKPFI